MLINYKNLKSFRYFEKKNCFFNFKRSQRYTKMYGTSSHITADKIFVRTSGAQKLHISRV
jgi:hypothetical protein